MINSVSEILQDKETFIVGKQEFVLGLRSMSL